MVPAATSPALDPTFTRPLARNEAHVWHAFLDVPNDTLAALYSALSSDEQHRAARFVFDRDRHHFIAARGILRVLLARYLFLEPAEIAFSYGPHGKPALVMDPGSTSALHFNVSHSNGLALFAFALDRHIGIDIEKLRPDFAGMEMAEHFFSDEEIAQLRAMPAHSQARGFFNGWTRKEAYSKAKGGGLQIPLKSFSVSLGMKERVVLKSDDSNQWSLRSFEPCPGFIAALAVHGNNCPSHHFEWAPQPHYETLRSRVSPSDKAATRIRPIRESDPRD